MNQKIESALALSVEVSDDVRRESALLDAGFDQQEETWQVILRYVGGEEQIRRVTKGVTAVTGGFGVAVVTEAQLKELAELPEVVYIEKPSVLSYEVANGISASCINPLYQAPYNLTGKNVFVGIIDSGIDIFHPDFRNEDGTTRVRAYWDQSATTAEGEGRGVVYDEAALNGFLENNNAPFRDLSGHGTHVAGIAAGNGRASRGLYRGVAWESDLLVVKLGRSSERGPQTAELMLAVDFCCQYAREHGQPLALNISYGTSYGPHNGRSLLDSYLAQISLYGKNCICVGAGNEGNDGRHKQIRLETEEETVELIVSQGETNVGLYLYGFWQDRYDIQIENPSGDRVTVTAENLGSARYTLGGTRLVLYASAPTPYESQKTILFEFVPTRDRSYINAGIWRFTFVPKTIKMGIVELWLPSGTWISADTFFLQPTRSRTITLPGLSGAVVTVGAYDARTKNYAGFSGRGQEGTAPMKPDLVAPGVEIISCSPGGGYTVKTGTSMACPFVTGSAALLMQWGIVNEHDLYFYGDKIKAALLGSATPLSPLEQYPNNETGWGALCARGALELN